MKTGVSREAFLKLIRRALGRREGDPVPDAPAVEEQTVRVVEPEADLAGIFAERAGEVGLDVRRCAADEVSERVLAFLTEIGAKRAAIALGAADPRGAIAEAIRAAGIELLAWQHDPSMTAGFEADAGITRAQAGVAETGSLLCRAGPDQPRGLSLAVPNHLAVLSEADLFPDLLDLCALPAPEPERMPSSQSLVTGPSKTADIEGELIKGVHGPGRVRVILVREA